MRSAAVSVFALLAAASIAELVVHETPNFDIRPRDLHVRAIPDATTKNEEPSPLTARNAHGLAPDADWPGAVMLKTRSVSGSLAQETSPLMARALPGVPQRPKTTPGCSAAGRPLSKRCFSLKGILTGGRWQPWKSQKPKQGLNYTATTFSLQFEDHPQSPPIEASARWSSAGSRSLSHSRSQSLGSAHELSASTQGVHGTSHASTSKATHLPAVHEVPSSSAAAQLPGGFDTSRPSTPRSRGGTKPLTKRHECSEHDATLRGKGLRRLVAKRCLPWKHFLMGRPRPKPVKSHFDPDVPYGGRVDMERTLTPKHQDPENLSPNIFFGVQDRDRVQSPRSLSRRED